MVTVDGKVVGSPRQGVRGVVVVAIAVGSVANACGGRSVLTESDSNENGGSGADPGRGGGPSGGVGGYGGDTGGYGGDLVGGYGGDTGGYGGAYGAYGGANGATAGYGGAPYGGSSYGGAYVGGVGGVYGGYGGVSGSYGGYPGCAGYAGTAGYAGSAGKGGGGGSASIYKACLLVCQNYPYAGCPSDFSNVDDCLIQCTSGFPETSPYCSQTAFNFLACVGQALNPNAMCVVQNGQCYGPGCTADALNRCVNEYDTYSRCVGSTPTPPPVPCPPPPDNPPPPGCVNGEGYTDNSCNFITNCGGYTFETNCYATYDYVTPWSCECIEAGRYVGTVDVSSVVSSPCRLGASACGFPG